MMISDGLKLMNVVMATKSSLEMKLWTRFYKAWGRRRNLRGRVSYTSTIYTEMWNLTDNVVHYKGTSSYY